jgi:hypothetical protein
VVLEQPHSSVRMPYFAAVLSCLPGTELVLTLTSGMTQVVSGIPNCAFGESAVGFAFVSLFDGLASQTYEGHHVMPGCARRCDRPLLSLKVAESTCSPRRSDTSLRAVSNAQALTNVLILICRQFGIYGVAFSFRVVRPLGHLWRVHSGAGEALQFEPAFPGVSSATRNWEHSRCWRKIAICSKPRSQGQNV